MGTNASVAWLVNSIIPKVCRIKRKDMKWVQILLLVKLWLMHLLHAYKVFYCQKQSCIKLQCYHYTLLRRTQNPISQNIKLHFIQLQILTITWLAGVWFQGFLWMQILYSCQDVRDSPFLPLKWVFLYLPVIDFFPCPLTSEGSFTLTPYRHN